MRTDTPSRAANRAWVSPVFSLMPATSGTLVTRPCRPRFSFRSPSRISRPTLRLREAIFHFFAILPQALNRNVITRHPRPSAFIQTRQQLVPLRARVHDALESVEVLADFPGDRAGQRGFAQARLADQSRVQGRLGWGTGAARPPATGSGTGCSRSSGRRSSPAPSASARRHRRGFCS